MKFPRAHFAVLAILLVTACNKEDYFGKSLVVQGADATCSAGTDIASCEAITGCQVAYEDVESVDPVFAACIANPPADIPSDTPADPSAGSDTSDTDPPTVSEAYASKCEDLDDKYLYIKEYSGQGKNVHMKKVKVCHQTAQDEHAIIVACPALKAHRSHNDYLGACKE